MAVSSIVKTSLDGQLTLSDGTGSPVSLVLAFDNGDLSISGLSKVLNEETAIQGRGKLRSVRYGARTFPTVSFTAYVTSITGVTSAPGSVTDFVSGTGVYSSNTSTLSGGDVYCVDLTYDLEGTDLGDSEDGQIVIGNVRCVYDFTEATEGTQVSITGTVYGTVTGDLEAAQIS